MKQVCICIFFIIIFIGAMVGDTRQKFTAAQLLEKIDENMVFKTAYLEMDMVITIKKRTVTKRLTSFSQGTDKAFMEFLSPPRDKGSKILKIEDIVRVYFPSAERVMRLSGHMLRQSMMGSDFSYEDMTAKAKKLKEEYTAEIIGEEALRERPCYLLLMTSKIENQTYFTRKAWVDKERFIILKEELYARSGKLLKVLTVDEVRPINRRYYPTNVTLENKLRKNSKTQMILKKIQFDIDIPEGTFSERNLIRK